MSKDKAMLKYMVMAPIARPKNFFKYGIGFIAIWCALNAYSNSSEPFVAAFVAYVTTKYLPPLSIPDLIIPIIVGAFFAGLKWRANPGF